MIKKTKQLLMENNALSEQLDPNYDKVLTDIVVYIRSTNISDYNQEAVRRDILNMMMEGAKRGDSVENIIGEDYKVFCDNVIAEVEPMKTKDRIIIEVRNICLYLTILIVIWFGFSLMDMFTGKISWTAFPVTIGNIVSTALIIFFSIAFITVFAKNSFNKSFTGIKVFLILAVMLLISTFTNAYINKIIFSVNVSVVIVVILILFITYKLLDQKLQ